MSPPPEQTPATEDSDHSNSGVEARSENSDVNGDVNAAPPRRSAWNRPSNGVSDGGSVMGGAVSWPALSESNKPVSRSSTDFSRSIRDGSASLTQGSASSQASQGQAMTTSHPKSMPSHHRQRSRNHSGFTGSSAGSTSSGTGPFHTTVSRHLTQPAPPFPGLQYQFIPPMLDATMTGARPSPGFVSSHSHNGNDNSSNRNSSRRANYGPRPRGEGQHPNNHGGRWDQDHRDVLFITPYMNPTMRFVTPPPSFFPPAPPPMSIFQQMGFDMSSFIYSPTMSPMVIRPPPAPMASPSNETPLKTMIHNQIDYYFSDDNLIKDPFLRSKMDENGWVPITLIASFRQVQRLTNDISLILESLASSELVEVQGDKVRRRDVWSKWLLPSVPQFKTSSVAASLQ